ncbi:MAG: 5-formyltetrahydrofolate cyclo-ligase [Gammaproteobacteria bacterium]|nr:5-formyltetrahydrofolate cyclo-ligase [Gammaproteobacteria bacterium]
MDRKQLRRELRGRRRALSPRQRARYAQQLSRRLASHPLFWRARRIAVYLPNDAEMDLRPLMKRARAMGKRCYLPVISRLSHERLWFAEYREGQALRPNLFGIPEPANGKWSGRSPVGLDLILMPLVGFDESGNRLGMGGGFYDRSLAYMKTRTRWRRPVLLGVAYECQKVDGLKNEAWDVPVNGVITEASLYWDNDAPLPG